MPEYKRWQVTKLLWFTSDTGRFASHLASQFACTPIWDHSSLATLFSCMQSNQRVTELYKYDVLKVEGCELQNYYKYHPITFQK